eukprot:m.45026 g.45026  ORF g.45026 m.45026 type:complete len:262 (-) comp10964_c0_seq1:38-823(-)
MKALLVGLLGAIDAYLIVNPPPPPAVDLPVSLSLQSLVHRVAREMRVPHPERIYLFATPGLSAMTAGTTEVGPGALLGLPRTAFAALDHSVVLGPLVVGGVPLAPDSPPAVLFRTAMVPSLEQIEFTVAHECAHLASRHVFVKSVADLALVYTGLVAWDRTLHRPRSVPARALIFGGTLCALLLARTAVSWLVELHADYLAARARPVRALAGAAAMDARLALHEQLHTLGVPGFDAGDFNLRSLASHPPLALRARLLRSYN